MVEYYIFDFYNTKLFCYRIGELDPDTKIWNWIESREITTGLNCIINDNFLSFFNGNYVIESNYKKVSREEFVLEYSKKLNSTDDVKEQVVNLLINKATLSKKR